MAIIKFTKKYASPDFAMLNRYPDQFVSEKDKASEDYWKTTMDYFYNVALQQYNNNRRKIVPNYELVNGRLRRSDFYGEPAVQSFTETILKNEDLPKYVRHYSVMTPVINDLVGELTKRPDNVYVKAMDEDSKSEEFQYRTDVLFQLAMDAAKQQIMAESDGEMDPQQMQEMIASRATEDLLSYTSQAEKWGSNRIEQLKVLFNLKEKSEDAFRDLLISARQFYHIYEDTSPLGFNSCVENPKNVWQLSTEGQKYTSDPLDRNNGAYAAGTVKIMEFSEVIHKFKFLTKDEIEHLRDLSQEGYHLSARKSSLVSPVGKTGPYSVEYDTYDPAILQYRRTMESEVNGNKDELNDLLGLTTSASTLGNKFLVVQAYWASKKKVGTLTYIDEDDQEITIFVDENYKKGDHPQEISIVWGWVNQWYQGIKIGLDIYHVKPLEILDYCPIIGMWYNTKNMESPISLVDQMKPFQMLYNIAMNKLFRLLEKDMGVVFLTSIRQVPVPKDGDSQDALEMWEEEAREKGIIFIDDSPENTHGGSSFNQHKAVDLSRSNEIQAMYNLAVQMRIECWKLVGISEQRLGESRATETATGINTALSQSYAQTEPIFAAHEYNLNKYYQALLDASLYIESHKEESTISYLSTEGDHRFVKMNGSDLKLKDLGVLVTSRAEDARNFQEFKMLSQAMLQNGATPYEVSILYSTKSMRKMQDIFKKLKQQQDEFQQTQQQIEQQKIEQQQAQFEQAQQLAQLQEEKRLAYDSYQKEQDRLSKERIAMIGATKGTDVTPEDDYMELGKLSLEQEKSEREYQIKIQDLTQKQQQILSQQSLNAQNVQLQKEKLRMDKYKADMDYKIAKENKTAAEMKARKSSKKK